MKLKSWVTSLAVLCVVAAAPADAAKISFSDQGWIDIGALVQTWVRVTQNGAAVKDSPSYDIFLRRGRILLSGQFNNYIGFIMSSDVSYTVAGGYAAAPADAVAVQDALRFHSPIFVMNEILGTFRACKEFTFDAGLMLLPWAHNSLTSSAKFLTLDEHTDITQRGRPAGYQARDRDVGLEVRGLLFADILYYRIGVFNGVQSANGTQPVVGPPAVAGLTGVNPGDSPSYNGTLRINILGKEDGYAFCEMCFASSPLFSVGFGAAIQPRAVRSPARGTPGATYNGYFADIFLNLPFGDNEFVLSGTWVRTVYSGNGGPLSSANAAGLALINNAGNGFFGQIGIRFGWFAPTFALEYYNSNLNPVNITSTAMAFSGPAFPRVGDLTSYKIGLNFYPEKATFNIRGEFALENKQNAGQTGAPGALGNGGAVILDNQWAATVQFQWAI
jgi:hypothetical protein